MNRIEVTAMLLIAAVFCWALIRGPAVSIRGNGYGHGDEVPGIRLDLADEENARFVVYPYKWMGVLSQGIPYYYATNMFGKTDICAAGSVRGYRIHPSGVITDACLVAPSPVLPGPGTRFYALADVPRKYKEPRLTMVSIYNFLYVEEGVIDLFSHHGKHHEFGGSRAISDG